MGNIMTRNTFLVFGRTHDPAVICYVFPQFSCQETCVVLLPGGEKEHHQIASVIVSLLRATLIFFMGLSLKIINTDKRLTWTELVNL